jgi:hypothetical protein
MNIVKERKYNFKSVIKPGETVIITQDVDKPFRCNYLDVICPPEHFVIKDIMVGRTSLFVVDGEIPLLAFIGNSIESMTAPTGTRIKLEVRNCYDKDSEFEVDLVGQELADVSSNQ